MSTGAVSPKPSNPPQSGKAGAPRYSSNGYRPAAAVVAMGRILFLLRAAQAASTSKE